MATAEPNWDALRDVVERTKSEHQAGRLTAERFDALLDEAKKAVNGHEEFLESLLLYAPR